MFLDPLCHRADRFNVAPGIKAIIIPVLGGAPINRVNLVPGAAFVAHAVERFIGLHNAEHFTFVRHSHLLLMLKFVQNFGAKNLFHRCHETGSG